MAKYRAWAQAQGRLTDPLLGPGPLQALVQATLPDCPPPRSPFKAAPYAERFRERGDTVRARSWFERAIASGGWPTFGFIVAERELRRLG